MDVTACPPQAFALQMDLARTVGPERTGSRRFWTSKEIACLETNWPPPDGTMQSLLELLPGRTPYSVWAKARKLGLPAPTTIRTGFKRASRLPTAPHIDDAIRRCYESGPVRGSLIDLSIKTMRTRNWLRQRAIKLGYHKPRLKSQDWKQAELDIIRAHSDKPLDAIGRALTAAGMPYRSPNAIYLQFLKHGMVHGNPEILTMEGVGDILGIATTSVRLWIERGWLKGKQHSPGVTGSPWQITRAALRQFIIQYPRCINLRRVRDPEWFIDLLGNGASLGN